MNKQQELILIPKYQEYTEYMLEILIKIPRIEKFSMGNWYKQSMYETLKNIIYFNKITEKQRVEYLNIIDTELHIQRIYLRIMCKQKYIDRIVHRWVVDNFLEPYFVTTFISTSYACIKGRGMHKTVKRVQKDMLHLTRAWKEYYIIKMDIKKYFENIDKDILYKILNRKIKDKKLRWLIKEILYSNGGKTGLAIGNYTSQVFANIYLNEVDQYVKHKLKQKYYYRYMDDSVIFVKTKQEAKETLENIRNFVEEELRLTLNKKTQIFKNKQGVNFCGYKINEYRLKIRDRGKRKLKKKIKYLTKEIKEGRMTSL